ncbi:spermidine/putrescine ABC transporter substrate-binding protein [Vibrio taketomensis]|uniref:polyamine ABC transporter substrate-binding protein n=1 Tax=Vibrio taketomensis TaxID=2572923 RepID=UPI001E377E1B|nr:spermidine/putrescine ABC transporter substrate-binding protein [Vibrio taketomensis]
MTLKPLPVFSIVLAFLYSNSVVAKQLNLLMWQDTLSEQVIDLWHQQTNITLNITYFDNDDDRDSLLTNNRHQHFDVLILDNIATNVFGNLEKLTDLSQLTNRQHHNEVWNQMCGDYGQPYFWGTLGVVYRQDKVPSPPETWQQFINPVPELSGHIGMLNDTTDSFVPFLLSQKHDLYTADSNALKNSYAAMQQFSRHILTYEYPLSYITHHKQDELHMALAYSGDEHQLNKVQNTHHWQFIQPLEQPLIWLDCWAISKNSAKKIQAKQLLNFLADPKIAAINATDIKAATTNVSALKLMPDWYLNNALWQQEEKILTEGKIDSALSAENIRLRAKILTQLLNIHEAQY